MRLVSREMKLYSFPVPMARQPSKHWSRTAVQPLLRAEDDPYLLVLLADQELGAGREEQAKYLVEVAYEGFDQNIVAGFRLDVAVR